MTKSDYVHTKEISLFFSFAVYLDAKHQQHQSINSGGIAAQALKTIVVAVIKFPKEITIPPELLFWLIPKENVMVTFKKH